MSDWALDFTGGAELVPAQMAPRDQRLNDRIERRVEREADRQQGAYQPPAGYRVETPDGSKFPWVVDADGPIAEVDSLKNLGEMERLHRLRPTPESLKQINRWRGALSMPPMADDKPQAAPAAPPQTPQASGDDWASDFGVATPQPPPKQQDAQTNPHAEPDAKTWIGRRVQDVRGKTDSRYKELPNIARVLQDEGGHQIAPEIWGWGVGASDKDMGKVYEPMLSDRFVRHETDANGYPIIVYKGKDGSEQRAYVNSPGIDMQDVARGAYGAVPYVVGGVAGNALLKGAPLLGRMGGQGLAQAGASAVQDVAGAATGVTDLDLKHSAVKAGLAAGFGAAGEGLGAGVNALMRSRAEGQLFKNGILTSEGEAAARAAGIDPALVTGETARNFAKAFARSGDAIGAFIEATSKEFKIPRTLGELTGNRNQLLREQQMRGGTYGETARVRIDRSTPEGFDSRQSRAIDNAVRGEIAPDKPGIMGQIAPARAGQQITKGDIGGNIKANTQAAYDAAKDVESQAWKKVGRIDATPESLTELPGAIRGGVRDVLIDDAVTPMASRMAKALDEFKAGKVPAKAADILPDASVGDVGTMRKRLLSMYQSAATNEDKRAAKAIYDAYNEWIPVAAEKAGDPATAFAMRIARGISREVHETFEAGGNDAGSRIMQGILKRTDSPEGIVNDLLSAPGKSEIKNGARSAIQSLFRAYDKYLSPEAAEIAKGDIRLAYLDRMMNMKTGEVMTPGRLQTAMKTARSNQSSLYGLLFDKEQRATLMRLEHAMTGIEKKNPNTSWSAIGAGALMRDIGSALFKAMGGQSTTAKIVGGGFYNRVEKTVGGHLANKATGGGMGAELPALSSPSWAGYGGAYGASRTDSR